MASEAVRGRGIPDHPSSGKNQGELRTNQPQLTPAHPSSPQLRIANEKGNFVCPDSFQITKLLYDRGLSSRSGKWAIDGVRVVKWRVGRTASLEPRRERWIGPVDVALGQLWHSA